MELFFYTAIICGAVFLLSCLPLLYRFLFYPMTNYGFRGRLVYTDEGQVEPFRYEWGDTVIVAKPDFVYRLVNGSYAVVEFKSRFGSVYPSDVIQLKSCVLAVSEEWPVSRAFVATSRTYQEIKVRSRWRILRDIKPHIKLRRKIEHGYMPSRLEDRTKCKNCSFKAHCLPEDS